MARLHQHRNRARRRRPLHGRCRAAGTSRQLAADRRHPPLCPDVATLRHADRRCDAHGQGRADAGDRAKGVLMIRALLWVLGAILLGGIVHLSTVLVMPQAATQDAYARLVPLTPVNAMVPLAAPTAETTIMPFMDPAFAAAVCRYDLSAGAIKLNAPLSQG